MSVAKPIITCGFLIPRSQTRISLHSSSNFSKVVNNQERTTLLWRDDKRWKSDEHSRSRRFLVCAIQPGVPPPSEPSFNIINWILGVAITVVLPFFSQKWASLLKIKNEVEAAVATTEEIAAAVEKAAEGVEKFAEDIADDLPEGGRLRQVVDFVEHVAERAAKDAHSVEDFIDKVQEAEEKLEDYVESFAEEAIRHDHHKNEEDHDEDRGQENNDVDAHN